MIHLGIALIRPKKFHTCLLGLLGNIKAGHAVQCTSLAYWLYYKSFGGARKIVLRAIGLRKSSYSLVQTHQLAKFERERRVG